MNDGVGLAIAAEALMTHEANASASARASVERRAEWVGLATRHLDHAYKLAGYLLGDRDEAEDALQEALVRAWLAWPKLRQPESFGPWLDRIVANVCYNRIRARRRVRSVALDEEAELPASDPFRATLNRDAVGRAMERLTPEQRAVVIMRYWRDMPLDQIAVHLDLRLGTVKSRLHYAQRLLRREIER